MAIFFTTYFSFDGHSANSSGGILRGKICCGGTGCCCGTGDCRLTSAVYFRYRIFRGEILVSTELCSLWGWDGACFLTVFRVGIFSILAGFRIFVMARLELSTLLAKHTVVGVANFTCFEVCFSVLLWFCGSANLGDFTLCVSSDLASVFTRGVATPSFTSKAATKISRVLKEVATIIWGYSISDFGVVDIEMATSEDRLTIALFRDPRSRDACGCGILGVARGSGISVSGDRNAAKEIARKIPSTDFFNFVP